MIPLVISKDTRGSNNETTTVIRQQATTDHLITSYIVNSPKGEMEPISHLRNVGT